MTSFRKDLSLGVETRPFDEFLRDYSTVIHELDKKIGCRKISLFSKKFEIW
jgi:hypothetical protein